MENPQELPFNNILPKDIIFDIFSRIPLKKLHQITSTCKNWQFLLQFNLEFRSFYHKKHKINPILLFTQQNNDNLSTQLSFYYINGKKMDDFTTNFPQINQILTCNGILCLISKSNLVLYDPIIKRVTILPKSPTFSSSFSWAFGFSPTRKLFKVIHYYTIDKFDNFHYCQVKEIMCEIITIPNSLIGVNFQQDWRFMGKCPFNILGRKYCVNVDGKIYWLISEKKINPSCVKIMWFDLESEIFGMICFPKCYSNRSVECLDLVEIDGKLCLSDRLPWESRVNIWMMVNEDKGFSDFWVKKFEIDLVGVVHHDVRILGYLSVDTCFFGVSRMMTGNGEGEGEGDGEGEILMKVGVNSYGLYEVKSGVFKDLSGEIDLQGWNLELMMDRNVFL